MSMRHPRSLVAAVRSRLGDLSPGDCLAYGFAAVAVVAVVAKSATLPAPIDHWEYASWYLENHLLAHGFRAPECEAVLATGNYATHWPKLCTRLQAPALAYLTAGATAATGVDLTGRLQRFFLLTPAAKLAVGYLLVSLYTDDARYRVLGATALFLVPDYSPYYVTQAKGLSFVLLPFGAYARLRWRRDGGPWLYVSVATLGVLLLFYYPRALALFVLYAVLGAREVTEGRPVRGYLAELTANAALVAVLQFDETVRKLSLVAGDDAAVTVAAALQSVTGGGDTVPFLYQTSGPSAAAVLAPVALVAGLAGLRALRRRGVAFLLDERLLWLYALALVYVPAALAIGFFRTRIVFEAAIPGVLVAVDELDGLTGRAAAAARPVGLVLLAVMLVGNLLLLSPAVAYSDDYRGLADELDRQGVDRETPVYTDLRTGAYLVGEERYERVYRIVDDRARAAMVAVWYGTNATAACRHVRSTGAAYFVLNPVVTDGILFVENYPRRPIGRAAYEKFDRSSLFERVGSHRGFRIYRVDADCRPGQAQSSA